MYKVVQNEEGFKVKEVDQEGNSVRLLEETFGTETEANDFIVRLSNVGDTLAEGLTASPSTPSTPAQPSEGTESQEQTTDATGTETEANDSGALNGSESAATSAAGQE